MFDVMTVATTTHIHPSSPQKDDALINFRFILRNVFPLEKEKDR